MNKKNLLILERSAGNLELNKENSGEYILQGIFGEIDVKNKNNRIYTESEYVPQIKALQDKIKSSKLLGELDHPANFEISLKNVSHIIEELTYDEKTKQVRGRIRLLDTEAGKQAKALVDAGVPLQISSRAAGAVESNGQVKIKQLFTYDLVADPGFTNAELTRVNESFGISDDSDVQIYEINNTAGLLKEDNIENKTNKTMLNEENSKVVSVDDFNKYSKYLSEEIKSLKEAISSLNEKSEEEKEVKEVVETNDYSEQIEKIKEYTSYLAETLDTSISYAEHMAEGVNDVKEYTNYLAESFNESTDTVDGINEKMDQITAYTEYIAETVNKNLIAEDTTDDISDGEGDGLNGEEHPTEAGKELLKRYSRNNNAEGNSVEFPHDHPVVEDLEIDIIDESSELDIEIVSEEEVIEEGRAFAQAAKEAKDAGSEEFEFEGKTYPVTIKEDAAEDIEDEEKEVANVEELEDEEELQAESECKCGGDCKCQITEDDDNDNDEDDDDDDDEDDAIEPGVATDVEIEVAAEALETGDEDEGAGIEKEDLEDDAKDVTDPTEVNGKEVDETPTDKEAEQEAELEDEIDGAGKEIDKDGAAVYEAKWTKEKLIKAFGNNHDAYIIVKGKKYIVYNPDGNNADNDAMWTDKTVTALIPNDGDDKTFKYSEIDDFTLDEAKKKTFEDAIEKVEEDIELELDIVTEKELVVSNYRDSVHASLKGIIEESNRKPSTDPSFFNFVSESVISDFKSLEEDEKTKVLRVVEGNGFLSENQIVSLWNTALEQKVESELPVVALMPDEYKETWNELSEAKKSSLIAQSKYQRTETAYQVRNFWQTRDMRETKVVMEKVEIINEANTVAEAPKSKLPYEMEDMKAQIAKRFKHKR